MAETRLQFTSLSCSSRCRRCLHADTVVSLCQGPRFLPACCSPLLRFVCQVAHYCINLPVNGKWGWEKHNLSLERNVLNVAYVISTLFIGHCLVTGPHLAAGEAVQRSQHSTLCSHDPAKRAGLHYFERTWEWTFLLISKQFNKQIILYIKSILHF